MCISLCVRMCVFVDIASWCTCACVVPATSVYACTVCEIVAVNVFVCVSVCVCVCIERGGGEGTGEAGKLRDRGWVVSVGLAVKGERRSPSLSRQVVCACVCAFRNLSLDHDSAHFLVLLTSILLENATCTRNTSVDAGVSSLQIVDITSADSRPRRVPSLQLGLNPF